MTTEQYQSILDSKGLQPEFFTWQIANEGTVEEYIQVYIEAALYGIPPEEAVLALMQLTGVDYAEADSDIDDSVYLVLTDSEADIAATDSAEAYCDDIVLGDIPEHLQRYFDESAWVSDYLEEGRGEILACYDGVENEETVNGTTYYIYRT